jgi:hypothetical protein
VSCLEPLLLPLLRCLAIVATFVDVADFAAVAVGVSEGKGEGEGDDDGVWCVVLAAVHHRGSPICNCNQSRKKKKEKKTTYLEAVVSIPVALFLSSIRRCSLFLIYSLE